MRDVVARRNSRGSGADPSRGLVGLRRGLACVWLTASVHALGFVVVALLASLLVVRSASDRERPAALSSQRLSPPSPPWPATCDGAFFGGHRDRQLCRAPGAEGWDQPSGGPKSSPTARGCCAGVSRTSFASMERGLQRSLSAAGSVCSLSASRIFGRSASRLRRRRGPACRDDVPRSDAGLAGALRGGAGGSASTARRRQESELLHGLQQLLSSFEGGCAATAQDDDWSLLTALNCGGPVRARPHQAQGPPPVLALWCGCRSPRRRAAQASGQKQETGEGRRGSAHRQCAGDGWAPRRGRVQPERCAVSAGSAASRRATHVMG